MQVWNETFGREDVWEFTATPRTDMVDLPKLLAEAPWPYSSAPVSCAGVIRLHARCNPAAHETSNVGCPPVDVVHEIARKTDRAIQTCFAVNIERAGRFIAVDRIDQMVDGGAARNPRGHPQVPARRREW